MDASYGVVVPHAATPQELFQVPPILDSGGTAVSVIHDTQLAQVASRRVCLPVSLPVSLSRAEQAIALHLAAVRWAAGPACLLACLLACATAAVPAQLLHLLGRAAGSALRAATRVS